MAWNPHPKVAAARDYGQKFGKQIVIILSINRPDGQLEMVSYGKTKFQCDQAKMLGEKAYDALMEVFEEAEYFEEDK